MIVATHGRGIAPFFETVVDSTSFVDQDSTNRRLSVWTSDSTALWQQLRYSTINGTLFATADFGFLTSLSDINDLYPSYSSAPTSASVETNLCSSVDAFYVRGASGDVTTSWSDSLDWAYMAFSTRNISNYRDGWDVSNPYWIYNGFDNTYDPSAGAGSYGFGNECSGLPCHWQLNCSGTPNSAFIISTRTPLGCPASPTQTGYIINSGNFSMGSTRTVSCAAGMVGTATAISCESNYVWTDSTGCNAVSCPSNSTGSSVPSGCTCNAGYNGTIIAATEFPFYSGNCSGKCWNCSLYSKRIIRFLFVNI